MRTFNRNVQIEVNIVMLKHVKFKMKLVIISIPHPWYNNYVLINVVQYYFKYIKN